MRLTFKIVAALASIAAAKNDNELGGEFLTPMEKLYGPALPVSDMDPWAKRQVTRDLHFSEEYWNVRRADNCVFPLEVVIVQDATYSFHDDYEMMRTTQIDLMTSALNATHPGTKYGVVSFRDIPIWTLGDPNAGDYCHRFEKPLSTDQNQIKEVYATMIPVGGGDAPEDQFGALIATAQSNVPGWSPAGSQATRLIVLATDSMPHSGDDGKNTFGLAPYGDSFDEGNAQEQCIATYYPFPKDVKKALENRAAYMATLVYDGDYQNGLVGKSWEWFNNYLGQTADFLEPLANDASNFWEQLSKVIKAIEDTECIAPTPAPTTTTAATTTTTTTTVKMTTPEATETPVGSTEMLATTVMATTTPTMMATTAAPTTTPMTTSPAVNATTTASEGECPPPPCESGPCEPAAVVIKLAEKPARLELLVENFNNTAL